jgi:hypothetical protein
MKGKYRVDGETGNITVTRPMSDDELQKDATELAALMDEIDAKTGHNCDEVFEDMRSSGLRPIIVAALALRASKRAALAK